MPFEKANLIVFRALENDQIAKDARLTAFFG